MDIVHETILATKIRAQTMSGTKYGIMVLHEEPITEEEVRIVAEHITTCESRSEYRVKEGASYKTVTLKGLLGALGYGQDAS